MTAREKRRRHKENCRKAKELQGRKAYLQTRQNLVEVPDYNERIKSRWNVMKMF